ncbi:MAG: DNA polymerase I [Candidatus Wallbacteria bacterium]|nr:DNA polymerase I [Candidatus Wallbacteria bacterium]
MEGRNREKILVIDGFNLVFRAFYAMMRSNLRNAEGFPTGALHGFFNTAVKTKSDLSAAGCIVAFDTGRPTFRHRKFDGYKAKRQETPRDLVLQIPKIKELVPLFGLNSLECDDFEADDVIGSLVEQLHDSKEIYILSGDRDLFQLLDRNVTILMPRQGVSEPAVYDRTRFESEFGLTPGQYLQAKALMGDPSDNVPGVPGIGEKTAMELLRTYGSLEAIYNRISELKPGVAGKLTGSRDLAELSLDLCRIRRDLDLPVQELLQFCEPSMDRLTEELSHLELSSVMKRMGIGGSPIREKTSIDEAVRYLTVSSMQDWQKLMRLLEEKREFAVDLETDSEEPRRASIVGISFAADSGEGFYLPVSHSYLGVPEQLPLADVLSGLKPLLESDTVHKICHNAKYEYTIFQRYGIAMQCFSDTMLASYLLAPDDHRHGLDHLCARHFDYQTLPFSGLFGKKEEKNFSHVLIERATFYSCEDADYTLRLWRKFLPELEKEELYRLFKDLEMRLVPVLSRMESRGVMIDVPYLESLSREFDTELRSLEKEIFLQAGIEFNLNSPKQLEQVLFERLSLPSFGRTAKGTGLATDVTVMEKLKAHHPVAGLILNYREFSKLKSTYVDALPRLKDKDTGRIHTSFNQTVAATGRLSSSEPNLQNIPVRSSHGRRIRHGFTTLPGFKLVSFDYSQIELRVLAHVSEDEALVRAFRSGEDIHTATAALIFDTPTECVTKDMRRKAKEINFGVVYGLNAYGLAERLEISHSEAREYLSRFFHRYPGIDAFIKGSIEAGVRDGFVKTECGRKRWLQGFLTKSGKLVKHGENIAVNSPIQGFAADLIKQAMIRIDAEIRWPMLLQIHDELIFEVPDIEVDEASSVIKPVMEMVYPLRVPLVVDCSHASNWGELK